MDNTLFDFEPEYVEVLFIDEPTIEIENDEDDDIDNNVNLEIIDIEEL